jgi:hypothetical protein
VARKKEEVWIVVFEWDHYETQVVVHKTREGAVHTLFEEMLPGWEGDDSEALRLLRQASDDELIASYTYSGRASHVAIDHDDRRGWIWPSEVFW